MSRERLALVGFMGAGKTTVGRLVAKELDYAFVDSDAVIEAKAGMAIPAIFSSHGEEVFRRLEREVLLDLCQEKRIVVATGGGAFVNDRVKEALKEAAVVFYLEAPFEVLWKRVGGDQNRPLLAGDDGKVRAQKRFEARQAHYEKAHIRVDATKDEAVVAREIVEAFHERTRR